MDRTWRRRGWARHTDYTPRDSDLSPQARLRNDSCGPSGCRRGLTTRLDSSDRVSGASEGASKSQPTSVDGGQDLGARQIKLVVTLVRATIGVVDSNFDRPCETDLLQNDGELRQVDHSGSERNVLNLPTIGQTR